VIDTGVPRVHQRRRVGRPWARADLTQINVMRRETSETMPYFDPLTQGIAMLRARLNG
jgi:hypothetical protein